MRHCNGEDVKVYEVTGEDLPVLLFDTAMQVERNTKDGRGWQNVTVSSDGIVHTITLYSHS